MEVGVGPTSLKEFSGRGVVRFGGLGRGVRTEKIYIFEVYKGWHLWEMATKCVLQLELGNYHISIGQRLYTAMSAFTVPSLHYFNLLLKKTSQDVKSDIYSLNKVYYEFN